MKKTNLASKVATLTLTAIISVTGQQVAVANTDPAPDAPKTASPELIAKINQTGGADMGQGLERIIANGSPKSDSAITEAAQTPESSLPDLFRIQSEPMLTTQAATWRPPGIQGLDVSSHQGNVNWQGQWDMGAKFAYVKATESTSYKNPNFGQQYAGSYNVGMVRGAYHFAIPSVSSAQVQADYFINNGGGWSADGRTLPPLLDIEYNPYPELGNTCYNMSAAQMVTWVKDFSNRVKVRTGRVPAIYTTTDWWSRCTGNSAAFAENPLHIASYNTVGAGTLPASWKYYSIWQYSSQGPFAGDSNQWNGTAAGLTAFARNGTAPAPKPVVATATAPSSNPMAKTYTIPAKTGVRYTVNGTVKAAGTYAGSGTVSIKASALPGYTLSGAASWTFTFQNTPLIANGDMIAIDANGALWNYGTKAVAGRKLLAPSGWAPAKEVFVTDWNSDGVQDVIAQWNSGNMSFYKGNTNGSFASGKVIGTGWGSYTVSITKWKKADKYPSIVARDTTGTLWNYTNLYGTGIQPRVKIGTGWNGLDFNAIDWDKDGNVDLLAKNSSGSVLLYRTDGTGKFKSESRKVIGGGWGSYRMQSAVNYNGAGSQGILATGADGQLFYYGTGAGVWQSRISEGFGWTPMKISG